jgi:predicted MFS family arabinose efflux permease
MHDASPGPASIAADVPTAAQGIWSRQLALLLLTAGLGLTSLNLALPVLPLLVDRATHRPSLTGIVTVVVAACTVVLELQTSRLLRRFRAKNVLLAAIIAQLIAMAGFALAPPLAVMLVLGGLTGAGFGTVATVSATMIGAMAPPGRQGEAIGYYGLAVSTPAIVAPPLALIVYTSSGSLGTFTMGVGCCLVGALLATRLGDFDLSSIAPLSGALATLARPPVLLLWLSFVCITVTYGATTSFTPFLLGTSGLGSAPVFLLVFGVTRAVTRLLSGRVIDRFGDRRLVLPSLVIGGLALALLPAHIPVLTVVSAAFYGGAFGIVQTGTFIAMLRTAGGERATHVSGLWNMGVDVGFGTGALLLAPLAAWIGYPAMFWTLPCLFAVGLLGRLLERPKAGAAPA